MTDSKNLTDEQIDEIREYLRGFASHLVETVDSEMCRPEFPPFMQEQWEVFLKTFPYADFECFLPFILAEQLSPCLINMASNKILKQKKLHEACGKKVGERVH